MTRHPWTAFYWDDWDADTSHLTMVEKGAYLELLKHYYRTGLPVRANAEHLLRICSAHTEQEKDAVTSVLCQFFSLDDCKGPEFPSVYRNKRADAELAKRSEITIKRSAAGQRAWVDKDANAKQVHSKSTANAFGLHDVCILHPHPQSHTQEDQKKERIRASRLPEDFAVTQDIRDFALLNNLPDPDGELGAFKDYWRAVPGSKGRKQDWPSTFRNWLRRAAEYRGGNNGGPSKAQQRTHRGQRAILDAARDHAWERVGTKPPER